MKDRVRDRGIKDFSTEDRDKQQEIVPVVPARVELRSLKSWDSTKHNTIQNYMHVDRLNLIPAQEMKNEEVEDDSCILHACESV
jgi:hypothetical protein